jgi:hypothetical protein
MATLRLADSIKKTAHGSRIRVDKSGLVYGHSWHLTNEWTTTPHKDGAHRHMLKLCLKGHIAASPRRLRGRPLRGYARALVVRILRTTRTQIPDDWVLHSQFQLWPPKHRKAILWVLVNVVLFRNQQKWHVTLHEFIDFLKRSKWKLLCLKRGKECVGNYLVVMG